jgi:hypothetical protein
MPAYAQLTIKSIIKSDFLSMFYKNEREYILSTYDLYETAYDNGIDAQGMQIQTFQCKNE